MKNQGKGAQKKWERKVLWLLFCPIGHKKAASKETAFDSIRLADLFFQIHGLFHQFNRPWHIG